MGVMGARRWLLAVLVCGCGFVCVLVVGAGSAVAAPLFGGAGSEAGQVGGSEGMAVDRATGDVYVSDTGNDRVDKFDGSGKFLLAWGQGVLNGADEAQTCTTSCQKGRYGLGAGGFADQAGAQG